VIAQNEIVNEIGVKQTLDDSCNEGSEDHAIPMEYPIVIDFVTSGRCREYGKSP